MEYPTTNNAAAAKAPYDEIEDEADIVPRPEHLHDQKEKQISVDPMSLRESSSETTYNFMLPPLASKPKFVSCSVPNSASSSPRFSKKKWKHESHASPSKVDALIRKDSSAAFSPIGSWKRPDLNRSKSYNEGRESIPFDDEIDFTLPKENIAIDYKYPETSSKEKNTRKNVKKSNSYKCTSCLYLPSFGKAKPVRSRKLDQEDHRVMEHVISRTVSLEKFECGSWASIGISNDPDDDQDSKNYFDLPVELIKGDVNDAISPVRTAFVFDKEPKGVIKNASTGKSNESSSSSCSRHVRFSVSAPASPTSCITPRLQKARDEFNAFLAAQTT